MKTWLIYARFRDGDCGVCIGRRKGGQNAARYAMAFLRLNRRWVESVSWRPR